MYPDLETLSFVSLLPAQVCQELGPPDLHSSPYADVMERPAC